MFWIFSDTALAPTPAAVAKPRISNKDWEPSWTAFFIAGVISNIVTGIDLIAFGSSGYSKIGNDGFAS